MVQQSQGERQEEAIAGEQRFTASPVIRTGGHLRNALTVGLK